MSFEIDPHPFRLITESEYVCKLNPAAQEKAKKELNEDPKDRMDAVKFFREWIEEQPHLTFPNDAITLLFFLRTAKFSQLRARTMVEESTKLVRSPTFKPWFYRVDTHEDSIQRVIDSGVFVPLPKPDKHGRVVLMIRPGQLNTSNPQFTLAEEMRGSIAMNNYHARDENLQVNGNIFLVDMSGMNVHHITRMNDSNFRNLHKKLMGNYPGRMKGFHYYNGGVIIEALLAFFGTFMKKKYQERIVVHKTAEDLYKALGKEVLPLEYLPDDYKGPTVGTLEEIKGDFKKKIMNEEYRQHLLRSTGDEVSYDETKKPKEAVEATFRKLNVD